MNSSQTVLIALIMVPREIAVPGTIPITNAVPFIIMVDHLIIYQPNGQAITRAVKTR